MNARLYVVRFSNEDVIATSERPVPKYCGLYGYDHFLTDGGFEYAEGGGIVATGQPYVYSAEAGLIEAFNGLPLPLAGEGDLVAGAYYFSDQGEWQLCPIQNHGH